MTIPAPVVNEIKTLMSSANSLFIQGVLALYGWVWFFAPKEHWRTDTEGPVTWGIRLLAKLDLRPPVWATRLLLEHHPWAWVVAAGAFAALLWGRSWLWPSLLLLGIEWYGFHQMAQSYLVVALGVGWFFALFAWGLERLPDPRGVKPSGDLFASAIITAVYPVMFLPMLVVGVIDHFILIDTSGAGARDKCVEVARSLRGKPVDEMTALDLAHALWLARNSDFHPHIPPKPAGKPPGFGLPIRNPAVERRLAEALRPRTKEELDEAARVRERREKNRSMMRHIPLSKNEPPSTDSSTEEKSPDA
ncbi:MAG: hypothetical protein ACRC20_12275 [Segniliparus sp.]|uniref:hypothetical protein n=1 Tax=Segniliparus sp. TaxID=2804064 RepID=UPI003F2CB62E